MAPAVQAVKVPVGSVLVLSGVEFGGDSLDDFADEVERACAHRQFAILVVDDGGEVEVWGPDVDLKAKVQELLGKQAAA